MPRVNVQSCRPTSAWPVASAPAPAPACRKVTIARRMKTPAKMVPASRVRTATKPSATPSFCRLTTGYSATAVPMPARATIISRTTPTNTRVSGPGPTM